MKKRVSLVLVAAMLVAGSAWAQEEEDDEATKKSVLDGLSVGVKANFGDVAADDRVTNIVPFAEYANENFFVKGLYVELDAYIGLNIATKDVYTDKDGADPKKFMFGLNDVGGDPGLYEKVGYKLKAGPGDLGFYVRHANRFQFVPSVDTDKKFGFNGSVRPEVGYTIPVAGNEISVSAYFDFTYASQGESTEDFVGNKTLFWVVGWNSTFGLGVSYEGDFQLNDDYNDNSLDNREPNDTHYSLTEVIISYVPPKLSDLYAAVTVDIPNNHSDATATGIEEKGILIKPEVSYSLSKIGLSFGVSCAFDGIGADKDKGRVEKVSITPELFVKYSF
jgi:hypothetical protein